MIDTFDFTLRYQRTPCARYHVRPLTLLQQDIMYRCAGRVTVADLADATKYTHPEIRAVLNFLIAHGLVKTLAPDPWLFAPMPRKKPPRSPEPRQGRIRRWLASLLSAASDNIPHRAARPLPRMRA